MRFDMMRFSNFLEWSDGDHVWLHGSKKLFDRFSFKNYRHNQQLGFGIHFTKDLEFAKLYGKYIYKVSLSPSKTFDETKIYSVNDPEYDFAVALYKRQKRYQMLTMDNQFVVRLDVVTPQRAVETLKQFGYDSVLYEAKYGTANFRSMTINHRAVSMVMLNPEQVEILSVDEI